MPSQEEEKTKGIVTGRVGEEAAGPGGKNYLLVVATDEYAHCPQLSNCVKDAQDLMGVLFNEYVFYPEQTFTLFNTEATRPIILSQLRKMKTLVTPDDNLVIYFSGHGDTVDDVGYWIPVEAHPDRDDEFVSTYDLKSRLDAINSFHTFVMADACFSGSLFLTYRSTDVAGYNKRSRWGLAASHSRERALDGTPGENSPFAARLLKRLRDSQEHVGVQELAASLIKEVHAFTKSKQTPVFKPLDVRGDDGGQFVFQRKQLRLQDAGTGTPTGRVRAIEEMRPPDTVDVRPTDVQKVVDLASIKSEIRKHISQGDLEEAFRTLDGYKPYLIPKRADSFIQVQGQFNRLLKNDMRMLISEETKRIEYAKITQSLMYHLDQLKEDDLVRVA